MPGAAVERAGAREPGLAAARGAVLCSGHVGFAPCPAGGAAEGRGEWVPSPGRAPRGEGGLPAPARQRRWELGKAGPQPVPTGQVPPVARGCLWVQEGAWGAPYRSPPRAGAKRVGAARFGGQERALSGSGPDPAGTGAVPAPAPGVAGLCGHSLTVPRLSLCRDGQMDGRRSPATPGAAEPPGRSRAACAEADAAACPARGPAPGWGQPCLARPVTPRLQGSCLGPRLFWVPFQLPVPSVWLCGLLSVAGPARGRLQFSLQAQLSFGSCSSSWTAPVHFHARLRMVPARLRLWFGRSSSSSPLPVPFSTRSFWLQLVLVKTILAFGKVVNQSLS